MAIITANDLELLLDDWVDYYLRALGDASLYGIGEVGSVYGAAETANNHISTIMGLSDPRVAALILAQAVAVKDQTSGKAFAKGKLARLFRTIELDIRSNPPNSSVTDLDTYLLYLNTTGTKWEALAPPGWRDLYHSWKLAFPRIANLYFEILQGSAYPNALRKADVGGMQTAGASVDTTKYAGGFPQVRVSGLFGSGIVTITGTAFDPATQTHITGRTFTANVTGNGVTACVPGTAPADSLIAACTNITWDIGIMGGTIYAEAARPTGRPALPRP